MLLFSSGNEEPADVGQDLEVEVREGVNEQHGENPSSNQVKTGTTQHLPIRLKLAIPVTEVVLIMI